MNIFLTNTQPDLAAMDLCDLRLNKMILETAQMLCTAYRHLYPDYAEMHESILYKPTHANHPCSIWMRADYKHYLWSLLYFKALAEEKYYRNPCVVHLSFKKLWPVLSQPFTGAQLHDALVNNIQNEIKFTFDCSNTYPTSGNTINNYKLCLLNKWRNDARTPKWTGRKQPDFSDVEQQYNKLIGKVAA